MSSVPWNRSTAPYTFVPFAPRVKAGTLWGEKINTDLTAAFDTAVPGTLTGHIDVTIRALTPLHLGAGVKSFTWPDGTYGIPGATWRGCVKATLSCLLGGPLGLDAQDPMPVYSRFPVASSKEAKTAAEKAEKARQKDYQLRRLHSAHQLSPNVDDLKGIVGNTVTPGKQRVGLLKLTPDDHGGTVWTVTECSQLKPPGAYYRVIPKIRWAVVHRDLALPTFDPTRPETFETFAAAVRKLHGVPIYVVWADVDVVDGGRGAARRVAYAAGRNEAQAVRNAEKRRAAGAGLLTVRWRAGRTVTVTNFIGNDGSELLAGAALQARAMVFFPTNLNAVRGAKVARRFPNNMQNAYLLEPPGTTGFEAYWAGGAKYAVPEPVKRDFDAVLGNDYWKDFPSLAAGAKQRKYGWPVFFDIDQKTREVANLGGSGGFHVRSTRTMRDTVDESVAPWVTATSQDRRDVDAVTALFGAETGTDGIAGRLSFGHAAATRTCGVLPEKKIVMMGAKPAPHLRLDSDENSADREVGYPIASYNDPNATYRGRQVYLHRGDWGDHCTSGEWKNAAAEHGGTAPNDEQGDSANATPIEPLRPGATFTARLEFTNLARAELGALLFALTLGDHGADEKEPLAFAHRIGGFKALGLGSIHIRVDTVNVVTADRYKNLAAGAGIIEGDVQELVDGFLTAVEWGRDSHIAQWVEVPETKRSWPRHVAATLFAARWRNKLTDRADTREMEVKDHRLRKPLRDIFSMPWVVQNSQ